MRGFSFVCMFAFVCPFDIPASVCLPVCLFARDTTSLMVHIPLHTNLPT